MSLWSLLLPTKHLRQRESSAQLDRLVNEVAMVYDHYTIIKATSRKPIKKALHPVIKAAFGSVGLTDKQEVQVVCLRI